MSFHTFTETKTVKTVLHELKQFQAKIISNRFCSQRKMVKYSQNIAKIDAIKRLPTIINDYQRLPMTTNYYQRLPMNTNDYKRLQTTANDCKRLQTTTNDYQRLSRHDEAEL